MNNKDKILADLRKQYSDEEIADAFMIPEDLPPEVLKKETENFKKFR